MQRVPILLISMFLTAAAHAQLRVETLATGFDASGDVAVGPDGAIHVGNYGSSLQNSTGDQVVRITPSGEVSVLATGAVFSTVTVAVPSSETRPCASVTV